MKQLRGWMVSLWLITVLVGCQSNYPATGSVRASSLAHASATAAATDPDAADSAPVAATDEPAESAAAAESLATDILNPAVLNRPLPEIMPSLFVSETENVDALAEELATGAPPPADPVPISSLWQPAPPVPLIPSWSETENFLILGTDRRPGWEIWRTDVIMIVGVDRVQRRAAIVSIPRDLYVPIPARGWERINTVDFIGEERLNVEGGGPALVAEVLKNTLGVPIQHWVRVEMQAFEELVDAVGGVTIHLECAFYEPILDLNTNSWTYFSLPPGDVTLDGESAHWYARLRLRESDFGRARRQRQLLWALRDKMLSANLVLRLPDLWQALDGKFATDLSLLEIVELAQFGLPLNASRVKTSALTFPELEEYTTPSGGSVLRIAGIDRMQEKIGNVWNGPSMTEISHPEGDSCPPPPYGAPIFPTPTPGS